MASPKEHFPQIFLSGVKAKGDRPFIYERHAKMFVSALGREVRTSVNTMGRALNAAGVTADSRVAFCGLPPSRHYWITEMAALSIRAAAVIIPAKFPVSERISVLAETRSRVAVVATVAEAAALAGADLPDLAHIVCMEGGSSGARPVHSWDGFVDAGRMHPDHTSETFAAIAPTDTALLFYREKGKLLHKVERYDHAELVKQARGIERMIGDERALRGTDIVLSSPSWDNPAEHIASCYLPLLKGAATQINTGFDDFTSLENHPQVLVAPARHLEALKAHIEKHFRDSGKLEWKMLQKSVAYGKRKYEKDKNLGGLRGFFDKALRATVVRRVSKLLGPLRLIIGADNAATYDTQLFFHAFGVELVEIPVESLRFS